MGLSLISVLEIQGNKSLVEPYEDPKTGRFGYAITRDVDEYYRPIISCGPKYESSKIAMEKGKNILQKIKNYDLSQDNNQ